MYSLKLALAADHVGRRLTDEAVETLALRDLRVEQKRFVLNGRKIMLRGTLDCCEFPLTGYPAMEPEPWRRIFRILREHGLNHMRCHTWTPPEAAYVAADELGVMIQVELPVWHPVQAGTPLSDFIRDEARRVIAAYGNHPSFAMLAIGNEIDGEWNHLDDLTAFLRAEDEGRRLYTSHANNRSPEPLPQADYFVSGYHRTSMVRIHGNMESAGGRDYSLAVAECRTPLVTHEMGQCVVHPDFTEIPKYKGVLKPYNLKRFRRQMQKNGTLAMAETFKQVSGHVAWKMSYKADIEAALATPGYGGFQLLGLNDFPGQGEALVGLLDTFWDGKGLMTPGEFRQFCGETVPLLRMDKTVWSTRAEFAGKVLVNHHGREALANQCLRWRIFDDANTTLAGGEFRLDLPQGEVTRAGEIRFFLREVREPKRLHIELELAGTSIRNAWWIWAYPETETVAAGPDVVLATTQDEAREALRNGRKVLLALPHALAAVDHERFLRTVFNPLFWSKRNIPTVHPGTLGAVCDPKHPALAGFLTEAGHDWQWQHLLNQGVAIDLTGLRGIAPIVTCIDDFHRGRHMAFVIEGRVGRGHLLLSGFDLTTDLDNRITAKYLRRSLIQYLAATGELPETRLNLDEIFKPRPLKDARVLHVEFGNPGFRRRPRPGRRLVFRLADTHGGNRSGISARDSHRHGADVPVCGHPLRAVPTETGRR